MAADYQQLIDFSPDGSHIHTRVRFIDAVLAQTTLLDFVLLLSAESLDCRTPMLLIPRGTFNIGPAG